MLTVTSKKAQEKKDNRSDEAKMQSCVRQVKKEKGEDSAYAICTDSIKPKCR